MLTPFVRVVRSYPLELQGPILPHVTHLFNVTTFHHREPGLGNVGILGKFPNLPEYAGLSPPSSEIIGDMVRACLPSRCVSSSLTSSPTASCTPNCGSVCIGLQTPSPSHLRHGRCRPSSMISPTFTLRKWSSLVSCDLFRL